MENWEYALMHTPKTRRASSKGLVRVNRVTGSYMIHTRVAKRVSKTQIVRYL